MCDDNYEIERKFLIEYPKKDVLERCTDISSIEQTYLKRTESGRSDRVRKRGSHGDYVYTHTRKTHISDMRRIEDESEISEVEYLEFLKTADPERSVIYKTRCCLEYKEQLFEIDVYPFWSDRAVMEIELEDEGQAVYFPPDIKILREITEDRRYTNSAMAKKIPDDMLI